ncbi:DUF262 domain-containing protein [Vibrio fluvialis]|nr:DUF262 domain-containing protein [Vibrio fluvialis]
MHFNDVLSDIEKLVGRQLQSINPKTPPIYITKIDHESKKYFISSNPNKEGNARFFWELEDIWSELARKGFCSVDQALFGSGSSRNQPETIFAHLPYIQHFRLKARKHIFLRGASVHELGTLSELTGDELSQVLAKIDNYLNLSCLEISEKQSEIISKLTSILKKAQRQSVDDVTREVKVIFDSLVELERTVSNAVVTINSELIQLAPIKSVSNLRLPTVSVEEYIEDETFTGIENEPKELVVLDNWHHDSSNTKVSVLPEDRFSGGLRIRHMTPVLSLIFDRLSFEEIELQPDFQREDRIWKPGRKSKLIESILMGLPLPAFYFAEKIDGDWIVVDGLQRITTVFDFMRDDFSLDNLESIAPSYNGLFFSDLSRLDKRKIREYQITAHIIDAESDKENLIVELFHRINTYGVQLSSQEIRSAMYQGSSVTLLRYLSSSNDFITATGGKISPQRQKDMELCLSALSYIVLGYKNFDYKTYDSFLCTAMKKMNQLYLEIENKEGIDQGKSFISLSSSPEILILEKKFKQGVHLAYEIFGEYAFKKTLDTKRSNSPLSKPLFEIIVATFACLEESQVEEVLANSESLGITLYMAISDDSQEFSTWESDYYSGEKRGFAYSLSSSTGKRVTIKYRFDAFRNILKKTTGVDVDILPVLEHINNDK